MRDSGKVAVARVVLRSKEHLVVIRCREGVLTMETMLFADEVIDPDSLEEVPVDGDVKTQKREVEMAKQLIDSLSGDFEPDKYRDEYRERVLEMIERKAEGEEIAVEPAPERPKEVPDLMAALEASIQSTKRQGGAPKTEADGGRRRSRARSGSSRKKTAKKS